MKSKPSRAERGRFSVRRNAEAVVRVLRGEELDALSRELGVTAATLSSWRDRFLAGGESNLKERENDARDGEIIAMHTGAIHNDMPDYAVALALGLFADRSPCALAR